MCGLVETLRDLIILVLSVLYKNKPKERCSVVSEKMVILHDISVTNIA